MALQDVNGDGLSDLVAAWGARDGHYDSRGGGLPVDLSHDGELQAGHSGASDLGRQPGGSVIFSGRNQRPWATAAGDVDGDSFGDVLVTLFSSDAGNPAELLLFRGSSSGLRREPQHVRFHREGWTRTVPVRGAGDLNGDGIGDFILSNPYQDRVDVFHGRESFPAGF